MEYINEAIRQLREQGMDLETEGEAAGVLGVHINCNNAENTITLTQSGLIKQIIEMLEIFDLPIKRTPLTAKPLTKDERGELASEMFSYSSVVGMLQHLQNHSQLDITYAGSQCARFVHKPKFSHEKTLIRIGQYLKGTVEKGLIKLNGMLVKSHRIIVAATQLSSYLVQQIEA
jgi:hypothetical protein